MYPFPVIVLQLGRLSEGLGFCSGNEKKKKKEEEEEKEEEELSISKTVFCETSSNMNFKLTFYGNNRAPCSIKYR